jgi:four helix bundle protein
VRVRVREWKQPSARLADGNGMEPHDDDLPRLDHENLDVYRCSLDFLRLALGIVATLPRGEGELRAQLKTAAMSVPLNIAEGAGKPGATDRARFHGIARGSAMECAALVDVCIIAGYVDAGLARQGKALVVRIVAMLSKMCR